VEIGLKTSLLFGTALSTALFHTLIPDHWLPFVLIGRARSWSARKTMAVSGTSALIHATLSVGLGLLAVGIGLAWARLLGDSLARASAVLLIVFGLGYAAWAWRKGGHFHPGGRLAHEGHDEASCADGTRGFHDGHLHYHADGDMIHGADQRSGYYLAFIVGINPCILILPIMFSSVERGATAVALVTLAYTVTTVALMVGLSVVGVVVARRIPVPGIARHMELVSGLLIALTGVLLFLFD
jgi:ABC-type nickel/cobalt efflux system permease component RcnA